MVVAVGREGIIASEVKLGAYSASSFETFLLEKAISKLAGPRIFIMDKARCHISQSINDTLESRGHTLKRLPPYSPHLNAAESVFNSIKRHVRLQDFGDRESLTGHINSGIQGITSEVTQGWIREAYRSFDMASKGEPLGQYYDNHDLVGEEEDNE